MNKDALIILKSKEVRNGQLLDGLDLPEVWLIQDFLSEDRILQNFLIDIPFSSLRKTSSRKVYRFITPNIQYLNLSILHWEMEASLSM